MTSERVVNSATGLRNSWETSALNWRSRANEICRRLSRSFNFVAIGRISLGNPSIEWNRNSVETPDYARGFGSPTLLVNRHDVAGQTSAPGNACCRLYADASGTLQGVPSVEQIVAALQAYRLTGPTQWRRLPPALPALLVSLLPNLTCPACWPAYGGGIESWRDRLKQKQAPRGSPKLQRLLLLQGLNPKDVLCRRGVL